MIRIGITLDDVLRDKSGQICKMFNKYSGNTIDFSGVDLSSGDFQKILGFNSKGEYHKFLYDDYSFEIFGEAMPMDVSLDKKFNLWHLALNDNEEIDEEIELIITNPMEYNTSIPFTYFFLSKVATRVREVYFPLDSMDIWKKCDILITADKKLIENTPKDKVCVKINAPYNESIKNPCNSTFNSFSDFIGDSDNLVKIVNEYYERRG